MTTLKFSDGEEFDLSGPFRKECRIDGWYVLGENRLIPVKDEQEADEYLYKFTNIFNHHPYRPIDRDAQSRKIKSK